MNSNTPIKYSRFLSASFCGFFKSTTLCRALVSERSSTQSAFCTIDIDACFVVVLKIFETGFTLPPWYGSREKLS